MQWVGLAIDLAIVAGLGRAFMRGSQVGLLRIIFDVGGLILAVVAAFLAYQHLGPWLTHHFHLPAVVTSLSVFSLAWVLVELSYVLILKLFPRVKSHRHHF